MLFAALDAGQFGLGLVGGGGLAGLAGVWVNSRQARATSLLEGNRNAIDGFDKLTARLQADIERKDREHADEIAAKNREIAELRAALAGRNRR